VSPELSPPRVLLVGAFDHHLHAHNSLRHRALERLGSRVTPFNLTGPESWLSRLRRARLPDRLARAVDQAAPSVVLVIEPAPIEAAAVARLKHGSGATWAAWFCDAPASAHDVLSVGAGFDHLFVADQATAGRLGGPGNPPTHYLAPGCDPSLHRPMRARDRFRANVVFAGAATPYRERVLSELVEFGLAIWGPGWRKTRLRDYCRGELLAHEDYVRAYAGASVGVSLSRDGATPDGDPPGCDRRLFELAAIGVPQVAENLNDLRLHFREGSEVLVFHDLAELRALTSEALQDRAWAEQVASGARQRALAEHTYMHRMAALLGTVRVAQPT